MTDEAVVVANAWTEAGNPREALRILAPELAANPDHVGVIVSAASAHLTLEDHANALDLAQRAALLAPTEEWIWRLVSSAYAGLGDGPNATATAETAHRLAPSEWETLAHVAMMDATVGRILPRSRQFAETAVTLAPDEPFAHMTLGTLAMRTKDLKTARREFGEVLRLEPTNADAANSLAALQDSPRTVGLAAAAFIDIIAADPNSAMALYNVRLMVMRALGAFHLILWATWLVGNLASLPAARSVTGDTLLGYGLRAGLAAIAVVGVIAYAARIRRQAGPRFRQFLATAAQLNTSLRTWAVSLGLVVFFLVAAAALPWLFARFAYGLCFMALLVGSIAAFSLANALAHERSRIPGLD